MERVFRPHSFRAKLSLAFSLTAVLPLIFALLAGALALNRYYETQVTNSLIAYANLEQQRIESQLNNVIDSTAVLMTYANSFLLRNETHVNSSFLSLLNFEQIRSHVRNLQIYTDIDNIRIYSDNVPFVAGDGINFFPMSRLEMVNLPQEALYERVPLNRLRSVLHTQRLSHIHDYDDFISFYRVIRNLYGEITAVIFIDYGLSNFLYREENIIPNSSFLLTDEVEMVIYQSPRQNNNNGYIYVQRQFDAIGWTLTLNVPLRNIYQSTLVLIPVYAFILIGSIILSFVFGYYMSNRATKRLYGFFDAINQIDDNDFTSNDIFTKRVENFMKINSHGDEFDNVMYLIVGLIQRNSALKDQAASHKIHLEKYKLAVLQEQIKPHFLYNALDTIHASMLLGKKDVVCRLTYDLSHFYRICLSEGRDVITIGQELKIVEHYLQVECVGYGHRITWEINAEEEALKCLIPKFTLQPLVENSIVHGMAPAVNNIRIGISVELSQGNVIIVIGDNGVGIDANKNETITKILKTKPSVSNEGAKNGFGLLNIHSRIRLLFGDDYGVKITPKSSGFENYIKIPMEFDFSNEAG